MTSGIAEPFLAVEGLHVRYSEVVALRDVSLTVAEGEVVGIIGPNGAGKSTLLSAIAGGVAASKGTIRFRGQNIIGMSPDKIARLGLSLLPEGRHIFGSLTVEENLLIGVSRHGDRRDAAKDLIRILDYFAALKERRSTPAGRLSGGEQQILAIARALMTRAPMILIDEPSFGLAPKIIDQIYRILLDLRAREKLTLLINEQSSRRIVKHADRIYLLRAGEIRLHGTAAELKDGQAIKEAYFGL
ncbi:branched-chain amino acid transport system ATP-binding protein [Nitrobacteraceae bacterium AZCC 2161]